MLIALHSAATASSFVADLPAIAHLKSVGRLVAMCSAVSLPVYPVAPKTTISYWRDSAIFEDEWLLQRTRLAGVISREIRADIYISFD